MTSADYTPLLHGHKNNPAFTMLRDQAFANGSALSSPPVYSASPLTNVIHIHPPNPRQDALRSGPATKTTSVRATPHVCIMHQPVSHFPSTQFDPHLELVEKMYRMTGFKKIGPDLRQSLPPPLPLPRCCAHSPLTTTVPLTCLSLQPWSCDCSTCSRCTSR